MRPHGSVDAFVSGYVGQCPYLSVVTLASGHTVPLYSVVSKHSIAPNAEKPFFVFEYFDVIFYLFMFQVLALFYIS